MKDFLISLFVFVLIMMFAGLLRGLKTAGKAMVKTGTRAIRPIKPPKIRGQAQREGSINDLSVIKNQMLQNGLKDSIKEGSKIFDDNEKSPARSRLETHFQRGLIRGLAQREGSINDLSVIKNQMLQNGLKDSIKEGPRIFDIMEGNEKSPARSRLETHFQRGLIRGLAPGARSINKLPDIKKPVIQHGLKSIKQLPRISDIMEDNEKSPVPPPVHFKPL